MKQRLPKTGLFVQALVKLFESEKSTDLLYHKEMGSSNTDIQNFLTYGKMCKSS